VVSAASRRQAYEEALVKGGTSGDLYYRLHVFCIELPPLRDRREDIPLVNHSQQVLHDHQPAQLSAEALEVLMRRLAGNVRERKRRGRALVVGRGPRIRPIDLCFSSRPTNPGGKAPEDIERAHIDTDSARGAQPIRVARILDIDRTTLYKLRPTVGETDPPDRICP
jgi:two-component system C4-dicarboxylate transport response regulator DctD